MTQTVITNHFNAYKADCEANNKPIVMDEFVFAYVPGLDHTADIDPNENLPSNDHIVGRFPVTQKGKINQDAVVYSIILGTDVGTWKFNWVGLVNSEHNFAGIIQHTREQEKTKNDPLNGQPGDSLVRNLITPYKNAAALTQIDVDADVWQIDFTQRLKAMDERSRQEALCLYEHASFIGDGWKVINHNGALAAMSGRGFVGGLLCVAPQNITIPTPSAGSNVYLTAKFEGQLNGSHQVITRIVTTTETLDTISIDGDVTTYRQKIAVFNSLSDIDDTRPIEWREKHLDTSTNPHPQYALKTDLDESTGELQRPATTENLGLTELATQQEVDQDLPSDKVVTTRTLGKAALIRSLQNFATTKANEAVATVMGGITKPELDSIRELGLALEQSGDAIRSLFTQIATKLNISTFETFQTAYNQFKAQTLSRLSEIESELPLKVAVTTFNDYKTWVQQELNKKWVAVTATLSRAGIVQLLDSITSTSTSHAATPNSVNLVNTKVANLTSDFNSLTGDFNKDTEDLKFIRSYLENLPRYYNFGTSSTVIVTFAEGEKRNVTELTITGLSGELISGNSMRSGFFELTFTPKNTANLPQEYSVYGEAIEVIPKTPSATHFLKIRVHTWADGLSVSSGTQFSFGISIKRRVERTDLDHMWQSALRDSINE